MKARFFYSAVLLFFLGCSKEEVTPREYPRVATIEALDIKNDGATFKGEIIFSNVGIKDHGFVWSDVLGPTVTVGNKLSLGSKTGAGEFEARCDRSLEQGKKYYMRAYAMSDKFVVYGNTLEFTSLGSKAPVVKDFFPATGTWGDTVTVVGENFSDENRVNIVKFGQTDATVIRSNNDTLLAIVPGSLTIHKSKVSVSVAGNSSSIDKEFQLRSPIIKSVTPGIGLQGTKVTITGEYLLSVATKVYFGDTEASVLNWSGSMIECLVPNRPNGEVLLKVQTGTGDMFATSLFKIQPEHLPELYQVQPTVAKIGEIIKLTGDYFATEPGALSVKFGNTVSEIISVSKTQIEVRVPEAETRVPAITVTSYGSGVSIDGFALKSPVISDFSPHRGSPGDQLIISGSDLIWSNLKVFVDDEQLQIQMVDETHIYTWLPWNLSKHEVSVKVTFYDQEFILNQKFKSPWIRLDEFPGANGTTNGQTMIYNNTAYIAIPESQNNEVWKFNGTQWNELNSFPGNANEGTFSFTVGAKGYIGGGTTNAIDKVKELWEYDFISDNWTKQSDIPHMYNTQTGFAVGSIGYTFDTDYSSPITLRMYNATADTWSIKSTAPLEVPPVARPFVIGTVVYLVDAWGAVAWKYTPSSNQWNLLGATPDTFTIAFSIGSVGYAGSRNSFYKFNTSTNTWTQEPLPRLDEYPALGFSLNGKGYIVGSSWYYRYVYEYDPNF